MKRFIAALLAGSLVFGSVNCGVLAAGGVETGSVSEGGGKALNMRM
ncbi:MAG: hypothetical protein LUC90_03185 [Lachnospiraceae bacterium]|nr:hypothetical protein [Lachnospiraceae bacterium]